MEDRENVVERRCTLCDTVVRVTVSENSRDGLTVPCPSCGAPLATVAELHAQIAQEALGLGATDLRDDHVPVDGAMGEQPGR